MMTTGKGRKIAAACAAYAFAFSFAFAAAGPGPDAGAGPDEWALLAQKGYSRERVRMLMRPQAEEVFRGKQLKWIGMPIGGLFAGQVYIGGDGDLWNWDVHNIRPMDPGELGDKYYLAPMDPAAFKRIDQGFALRVEGAGGRADAGGEAALFPLNRKGFSDIAFAGSYPMARVTYADPKCPLAVTLTAYSPFEPLDAGFSSWPAVVLRYAVTNVSERPVRASLGGWLQNTAGFWRGKGRVLHRNEVVSRPGLAALDAYAVPLPGQAGPYAEADAGGMALALFNPGAGLAASAACAPGTLPGVGEGGKRAEAPAGVKLVGALAQGMELKPGEGRTCVFALTWYFPEISKGPRPYRVLKGIGKSKHGYARNFSGALDAAEKLARAEPEALARTRAWTDTWNDSTIPAWFRNRTFLNVATLATAAWVRLHTPGDPALDGRPYCWEGVYLGDGTCTHVLQYEQALGKVFPEIARAQRELVDYGLAFQPEIGVISYRGEFRNGQHTGNCLAVDGQLGTILRTCREWELSPDGGFLARLWPRVRKSIETMIAQDRDAAGFCDGILEGPQYNTLDYTWYGKIAWISGLYAAALRAGERMARAAGDEAFARECGRIAGLAKERIPEELFRPAPAPGGPGYFIHLPDPAHPKTPASCGGCHIDQLLGVYWADQTGLPAILPEENVREALRAIFLHNFKTDFGRWLKNGALIKPLRIYALDGEAGVAMCDFPAGAELPMRPSGKGARAYGISRYFSECWTGQEYPFAANLFNHGMPFAGLAVVDTVNRRYAPEKRNPYNEVEYGNHYTRAMSSFGAYTALCGYGYDAPSGTFRMRPKLFRDNFRAAFIASEGWGTFSQRFGPGGGSASLLVRRGRVRIRSLRLETPFRAREVRISLDGKRINGDSTVRGRELEIDGLDAVLGEGQTLTVACGG